MIAARTIYVTLTKNQWKNSLEIPLSKDSTYTTAAFNNRIDSNHIYEPMRIRWINDLSPTANVCWGERW